MQLVPLTPEQIHLGLRAMKTVAVANRTLSDEERALLDAVAETLGGTSSEPWAWSREIPRNSEVARPALRD